MSCPLSHVTVTVTHSCCLCHSHLERKTKQVCRRRRDKTRHHMALRLELVPCLSCLSLHFSITIVAHAATPKACHTMKFSHTPKSFVRHSVLGRLEASQSHTTGRREKARRCFSHLCLRTMKMPEVRVRKGRGQGSTAAAAGNIGKMKLQLKSQGEETQASKAKMQTQSQSHERVKAARQKKYKKPGKEGEVHVLAKNEGQRQMREQFLSSCPSNTCPSCLVLVFTE